MRDLDELGLFDPNPANFTDMDISDFERRFGVKLPESYINFLRFSNGGGAELNLFHPRQEPEAIEVIAGFYHLDPSRQGDGNLWSVVMEYRSILGVYAVPIANNGAGDEIYLDTSDNPASVRIARFEDGNEHIKAATSFDEFLDQLFADSDE